jgi:peptide/nickel transport system permease protein
MALYILRRLALAVVTLVVVSAVTFLLVRLSPGTPGQIILGQGATAAEIAAKNDELGWNRPLLVQFFDWLSHAARGDLGISLVDGRDIRADLLARLPVTAAVAVLGTLFSGVVGVVLGVTAAVRGGWTDRVVGAGSGVALSLPAFWVGIILVYVLSIRGGLLPATGYVPFSQSPGQWAQSMLIPTLTLGLGGAAIVSRITRVGLVDVLSRPHMRTLRSLGTPEWRLRYVHALRGVSTTVISVLGIQFIGLFGGSLVIEQVFAFPGLGQATQTAVSRTDLPAVQGVATLVVVVTNLLLDLAVAFLDPKVRTA